jgi:hypothetical protein
VLGNRRAADFQVTVGTRWIAGRRVHALKRAKDDGRPIDRAHGSNPRFIVVTPVRYVKRVATTGRSSRI